MEIKVVGPGCANCKKLLGLVQDAVKELDTRADVVYVTDMAEIMQTGIMRTPGLIVNGKVKLMGRVPSAKEVKQIISDEIG
jgi:small redox-active disulfide protein 2